MIQFACARGNRPRQVPDRPTYVRTLEVLQRNRDGFCRVKTTKTTTGGHAFFPSPISIFLTTYSPPPFRSNPSVHRPSLGDVNQINQNSSGRRIRVAEGDRQLHQVRQLLRRRARSHRGRGRGKTPARLLACSLFFFFFFFCCGLRVRSFVHWRLLRIAATRETTPGK